MIYKICILAAGVGSRMKGFTEFFNKVLIPIQGKPVICHIIEKFPKDIEVVIAVGYKKEQLMVFLKNAYPKRKFIFVDVKKFEGEGSGPGYSILQCRSQLQCPFIHIAGDTLVKEEIPEPSSNWLGIAEVKNTERFCSAKIDDSEKIIRLDDKIKTDNKHAYIGLLGVQDYEDFWESLKESQKQIEGEIQISNGIKSLLSKKLVSKKFTWFDTGTPSAYKHAQENYPDRRKYMGE